MSAAPGRQRGAPPLAELPFSGSRTPEPLSNPVGFDTTGKVFDRVLGVAESAPDREAVLFSSRNAVTYAGLVEAVEETCAALRAQGCGAGDVVACLGGRGPDTPVLFLALERLGAVYLPLDPAWPQARIREVLELSGSALLVDYTACPGGERVITRMEDSFGRDPAVSWPQGSDPRYVIYTSGTTGRPKGAIVAQEGMLNHLWAKIADLRISEEDRVAFTAPLVFDISVWQMLCPLMVGATVVIASENDILYPPRMHRMLVREKVTVVELVPTAISTLLEDIERRSTDGAVPLPSLRWLISTGEELKPVLAERALSVLPHAGLLNAYGPTECSDDVTHHRVVAEDMAKARLPVGRPVGNVQIYCLVHDPDSGTWTEAGTGETGELFVGGISVGLGYLGDPEATGAAFYRDAFDPRSPTGRLYRTGDLGRLDGEGVHYLGRVDRQVKVAGVRMELDEIEAVLSRHTAVKECAVTVGSEGKFVIAHYVPVAEIGSEDLAVFLRSKLPAQLVPRRWERWDRLPLTANGKVDHKALTAQVGAAPE